MNKEQALKKMYSPGMRRPGKRKGGVMQIHVTRACNLACFNCTQASNLKGPYTFISPENFEKACISLMKPEPYFGTVGVFGGNPAMHPKFDQLCEIMREHIPYEQRGLWCNDLMGKGVHARKTFNPRVSNLNVHLNQKAYDEFKRDWPESLPFGQSGDSRHSPPWVAMQDVIEDESRRWELISNCDINQHWSAMICEFRGQPRGYFCEIAGAQAMLHQHEPDYPDLGSVIYPGWWKQTMQDFADQVNYHCHRCGIPLRGYGELAQQSDELGKEQVSSTYADVYKPKRKTREVQQVISLEELGKPLGNVIKYVQNANK